MSELSIRNKYIIGICIFVLLIFGYILLQLRLKTDIVVNNASKINETQNKIDNDILKENEIIKETKEIIVHVSGKVKNPGIVKLSSGSRLNDAIEKAGGLLKEADVDQINLASIINDGEKVYVPKIGEKIQPIVSNTSSNSNSLININFASEQELDKLPGVGPATAKKIIEYRTGKGKFKKIDDIKNVGGIGQKKFDNLKKYITI